ncbi:MAG: hypothetical protein QM757_44205 [Paludibaculum sp.]
MKRVLALAVISLAACGQSDSFDEFARLFRNDPNQPWDVELTPAGGRDGVRTFNISFRSPVEGRVPGVLVAPDRPGRFPIILFGHWMMAGSPMRNHTEFLREALVYARAGAVCLLLDTPLVRAGVTEDPDFTHGQEPKATLQMAREWRRALDILLARQDVDAAHVAYVGHSFSAGVGAKLAGVEKRIQSFVLMANTYSLREFVFDEQNAELKSWRAKVGDAAIRSYLHQFPWDDSLPFARHAAPSAVFLQNGRGDKDLPESTVRKSLAGFNGPRRLEFYDAGHALNSTARLDRAKWLQQRLALKALDLHALASIPQLR